MPDSWEILNHCTHRWFNDYAVLGNDDSYVSAKTKRHTTALSCNHMSLLCNWSVFEYLYNPGRHTTPWAVLLWQNYSDIIQVYCSMAGRGCTLAVCARPDGRHMLHIVWLVGRTVVYCGLFCSSKSRKGHITAFLQSYVLTLWLIEFQIFVQPRAHTSP